MNVKLGKKGWEIIISSEDEKRRQFAPSTLLGIAYDRSSKSTAAIAEMWSCAASSVRKMTRCVAQCWRARQEAMLLSLSDVVQKSPDDAADTWNYAVRSIRWDETKEKFVLPLDKDLSNFQQQSLWHVLLARQCITVGQTKEQGDMLTERAAEAQLVVPPVPCVSTTASTLWDGLFCHPLVKQIAEHMELVTCCADERVLLLESDQATSNEKLVAHFELQYAGDDDELPQGTAIIHHLCSLHQNSLTEASVVACCGLSVMNNMYSACMMLNGAGYFTRLAGNDLDDVIDESNVDLRPLEPPQVDPVLLELKDFFLKTHRRFSMRNRQRGYGCYIDQDPDDADNDGYHAIDNEELHSNLHAVKDWEARWDEYISVVNGKVRIAPTVLRFEMRTQKTRSTRAQLMHKW